MVFVTAVALLAAASCAYYVAALLVLWRHSRDQSNAPTEPRSRPGITIFKPASGAGQDFVEVLRSHAAQEYPDFEILVGVGGDDSLAREAVRKLRADFPLVRIELVTCPAPAPGRNGKVEVLQELARHASKPVWVLSDADIGVPGGYLASLSAELQAPKTGMVTCLYRAEPDTSLLVRLESCRINTEFPSQVLLAKCLQGLRFGLGSSMALRAETLAGVGGFPALRNFIGDDYHLGARVAAEGLSVRLSAVPVITRLSRGATWQQSWRRQLRWSRTIRKQRPLGHFSLALTFAVPWSALALLAEPGTLWPLAAATISLRLAAGDSAARLVRAKGRARSLWLIPAADLCAAAVWLCSLFGSEVWWAGRRLRLGPDGRIVS
ncbi:MAG: glycosyltransferase [Bryobacterales bacterium]|nr:glycosyltransferase [Bryobacterales bacterium]MDE0622603.1 glycosyltransferase [Bryobacterales bacterium]